MRKIPETIKHLIILNVVLFLAPRFFRGIDLQDLFALHFPENPGFGYWQYLTHMFMHSQFSFSHILFNMYGLWAFGTPLEQMWGRNKFLFFYFSVGLGAGIIYTAVNYYQFYGIFDQLVDLGLQKSEIMGILEAGSTRDLRVINGITQEEFNKIGGLYEMRAVGASGAIYGVLVAFGLLYPNAKLALIFFPVPVAAKYFIPLMILGDFFFGVTNYSVGNVAHFAHIGGAIMGFFMAWYWKKNQFQRWD